MKNFLIMALVAAIVAMVAKIVYDVRKLVKKKNATRIYMVRVTSYHAEAFFFVDTKEEAQKIALEWRGQTGVLGLKYGWMIEQEAQLFKEILTQGFGFEKHVGADGAEMYVGDIPATKTPD